MAELTTTDLETYTGGRLAAGNSQTDMWLSSATQAARRFCGWYVCPVVTNAAIVVDGPGGLVLSLPTLNLLTLSAVSELGVVLDVTKLDVSKPMGTVRKHPCRCWTDRYGAISVTMTHGFTEAEAADWRRGVLQLADIMSLDTYGPTPLRDDGKLIGKKIDDVEYNWSDKIISINDQLNSIFSLYKILASP
jgi:hypothetical protein